MAGLLFVLLAIVVVATIQYERKIGENIDLRKNIAKELLERLKDYDHVDVDPDTGNIEFKEIDNFWFIKNSDVLLKPARTLLDQVMPIYFAVLFDERFAKNKLDRIMIEGHASFERDERYLSDLDLSQRRAYSVGRYVMMNSDDACSDKLRKYMVTLGRSFADAKHKGENEMMRSKDRRVVVRFTLQYEKMMRDLIGVEDNEG
jgi:outer membrane protein OmpA-like peptidoglycan-associated protein